MTILELRPPADTEAPEAPQPVRLGGTLSLWDGPNMKTTLCELTSNDPKIRFEYRQYVAWLEQQTPEAEPVESVLFLNIDPKAGEGLRQFVHAARQAGMSTFVKPKRVKTDDIDDDIVAMAKASTAASIVVATHDKELIGRVLTAAPGAVLTVIGVRELSGHAVKLRGVRFVDVDEIKGLVTGPIPRTHSLEDLPEEGLLLAPLRALRGRCPMASAA